MDLDKLKAAIDEAERIAIAARDQRDSEWWWGPDAESPAERHIALHDPERELRMVAAHRKILDLHAFAHTCTAWDAEYDDGIERYATIGDRESCATLLALAEGYGIEVRP